MHNHNGQVQDTLNIIIYTMIEMWNFVDYYSSSRPLMVFGDHGRSVLVAIPARQQDRFT